MKLSELNTGQAADVMIQITSCTAKITGDAELMNIIGKVKDFNGMNKRGVQAAMLEMYSNFIFGMLKNHRENLFGILAAVNGVDVKSIEEQPVKETLRQIAEIRDDEDLISFLSSFMPPEKKKQSAQSAPVLLASL